MPVVYGDDVEKALTPELRLILEAFLRVKNEVGEMTETMYLGSLCTFFVNELLNTVGQEQTLAMVSAIKHSLEVMPPIESRGTTH